jgi:hypothetical protein
MYVLRRYSVGIASVFFTDVEINLLANAINLLRFAREYLGKVKVGA